MKIGKEEIKLSLFSDNVISYIVNAKESKTKTKIKLLQIISVFGQVAEYKISAQKSIAFLYTYTEHVETKN